MTVPIGTPVVLDCGGVVHEISTRVTYRPAPKCDLNLQGPMRQITAADAVLSGRPGCPVCFGARSRD